MDLTNATLERGKCALNDTESASLLHLAVQLHQQSGGCELTAALLGLGADPNAPDEEGDTPLAHARYFGARGVICDLLRDFGASVRGPYFEAVEALHGGRN